MDLIDLNSVGCCPNFLDKVSKTSTSSSSSFVKAVLRDLIQLLDIMALGSACSPYGSQPILLSVASLRSRRSNLNASHQSRRTNWQNTESLKKGINVLMLSATIVAAVTVVMGLICTKVYITSASDLGTSSLFKKAVFAVFTMCNSVPMLTSVAAILDLIWTQYMISDAQLINEAMLLAMALSTFAFMSMLFAFMVGVCLVVILLIPIAFLFHISL